MNEPISTNRGMTDNSSFIAVEKASCPTICRAGCKPCNKAKPAKPTAMRPKAIGTPAKSRVKRTTKADAARSNGMPGATAALPKVLSSLP